MRFLRRIVAQVQIPSQIFLCLIILGYFLQLCSPLRINTDSYRLLSMAVSAHDGYGYLVDGQPDQFPLLYPFLIKLMLDAGIANSLSLVALNLISLFITILLIAVCFKTEFGIRQTNVSILFMLFSYVTVKHVTLPLTEFVYLALSSLSLFTMWRFSRQQGGSKWWTFGATVIVTLAAIQCRTIGIALIPALALNTLLHKDVSPFVTAVANDKRRVLMTISCLVCVCVILILFVLNTVWFESQFLRDGAYFQNQKNVFKGGGVPTALIRNVGYRVREFGEIFINIPTSKAAALTPLHYLIGLIAWVTSLHGAWLFLRQKRLIFASVYFFAYTAIMISWPFYDSRFWLPLLPFLAVFVIAEVDYLAKKWQRFVALASSSYMLAFLILGFISILVSTRASLSARGFSEFYGDGTARMTYRYVLRNGMDVDLAQVQEKQVRLIEIFEPLARPKTQ